MSRRNDPVCELSALLNAAQRRIVPHYETVCWFKLFRQVDADGSGLISYDEFVAMVRNDLKLSARALPESQMRVVWLALDTDGSGYLSSGEFGAFMRLGAPQSDRGVSSTQRRSPPRMPHHGAGSASSRGAPVPGEFLYRSRRGSNLRRPRRACPPRKA